MKNSGAHPYFVKFIPFTSPNAYHVVNTATRVTHTMWGTLLEAKQVCRDLNLAVRRQRIANRTSGELRLVKGA